MQSSSCSCRKVESTSDVNRGPELCQSGTALTFPVLCLYRPELSLISMVQCERMRMTTITLRIQNLTLSSLSDHQQKVVIHTEIQCMRAYHNT